MDRLDAGEAQPFVARRKQHQIDGRIKQADTLVRDRGNDVDPLRQSRGLDLRFQQRLRRDRCRAEPAWPRGIRRISSRLKLWFF